MAAAIEQATGAETELIASGGGVFEVFLDGDLIFSKRKLGRFPEENEILVKIRGG